DPLDALIAAGDEDLRRHHEALREVAAKIDPSASPSEVVDAVAEDHPAPGQLLDDVRALLEDLRQFSIDAQLCTMPTDVRIAVAETPGFSRMTTQAACSTPGPFQTNAKVAHYHRTSPDPESPAGRPDSSMTSANR